jgi:hypothetical protein
MYRAYFGTAGCGPVPPLEKDRWPFKEFTNLDEALLWTREVIKRGTAVIAIEGDDGTHLSRNEIASCMRQTLPAGT